MVKISECNKCIHNAVCSFHEDYVIASKKAIDELDHGIIILDVKCFYFHSNESLKDQYSLSGVWNYK